MSFVAGVGPVAVARGVAPQDPGVRCDICGNFKSGLLASRKDFTVWYRKRKAPTGWDIDVMNGVWRHVCKTCKAQR